MFCLPKTAWPPTFCYPGCAVVRHESAFHLRRDAGSPQWLPASEKTPRIIFDKEEVKGYG